MTHGRSLSLIWTRAAVGLLVSVILTSAAVAVTQPTVSAATTVPGAVPTVSVTAGEFLATVTWTAASPGGAPIVDYVVEARDAANKYAGLHIACGTCTSVDFTGLAAGRPYTFLVRARNTHGAGPDAASGAVVPTSALCGATTSCSSIDATTNNGPNILRAQGLLHGIDSWTPRALLDPLHLQNWRIAEGGIENDTTISTNETIMLSDLWGNYTYGWLQIYGAAPWSDWNKYRSFVSSTVQRYKNAGRTGLTWEIQNEPDISQHYDYYGTANTSLILAQFHTAYSLIKQVDPTAKIVGPSISYYMTTPGTRLMDLRTFLDYAAAHNLQFGAISWHESGGAPDDLSYNNRPGSVARHVQEVRAMIAARPALGNPEIHINEYSPEATRRIPGWSVGYIEALERANVDQAGLSCFYALDQGPGFSTCQRGVMDDLIRSDGTTHAAYWVHRAYAEMQGGRRLTTGSTDPNITAFSTTNGATIQVLVGRSHGCYFSRAYACPADPAPPVANHQVAVKMPSGTTAQVTIERIANQPATSDGILFVAQQTLPVVGGIVRVDLGSFADGDAYRIKLTPNDAGPPDPSPTTTALISSVPNAVAGQPVTFTATVAVAGPPTPGGSVVFKEGAAVLGTFPVGADRNARLTTSSLAVGSHTVTAHFQGTAGASASSSGPVTVPVAKASSSVFLQQVSSPGLANTMVSLRATIYITAPGTGTATGTVVFKDGATVIGTAPLVNRVANITARLSGGDHLITATYSGDAGRLPSTASIMVKQWYYIVGLW